MRLFPPERIEEEIAFLDKIARGERIDHFETVRLHKDGTAVNVSVTISPICNRLGAVIGASKIARDITQQKNTKALLQALNRELEQRVHDRTRELVATNDALHKANVELEKTQHELVRRERMSALGVLVAGVSHEMNTPLGNSLTVGSSLHDELVNFEVEVANQKISINRVREFNQYLHTGLDLLLKNLTRAIEQLIHFRQVSVDQAGEARRRFNLKAIVDDSILMIIPKFTHTQHRIAVDIPDEIMMDSFPGAIGQVITNLALNALVHGFSDASPGTVSIVASRHGDNHVRLVCSDNGSGIRPEILPRIFDPFFTTRMGMGGSGLGLNIVFNLASLTLGGSVSVESQPGERTAITVVVPLVTN